MWPSEPRSGDDIATLDLFKFENPVADGEEVNRKHLDEGRPKKKLSWVWSVIEGFIFIFSYDPCTPLVSPVVLCLHHWITCYSRLQNR
jgi:hypothetical protein